ncbi:hypothetical protein QDX92_004644 [Salmonella enterica]|nr:hypothetical protein [Salmonella enterica subsp. enterica serovar Sandiego]ECJ6126302.1 hypothetical protein [Salmonella enterica]EGD1407060.1 hypothetical protein [Salmonella enterica]EHH3361031.1 hypothetical protein [Salmonella enterica subsp. enterica serovar Sandiego]EJE9658131.1 hypothetical protein [Salmonella enterica]
MNRTVTGFLASILVSICSISSAGANEVVPERHDGWLTHRVSAQEGRRLLDTVPANEGELWVSGGISSAPCIPGLAEQRGDRIRIPLNGCDEGEVQTGPVRLPARIAWRTTGMPEQVWYPSPVIPGEDRYLTLPVDRSRAVSLLHLVMRYE